MNTVIVFNVLCMVVQAACFMYGVTVLLPSRYIPLWFANTYILWTIFWFVYSGVVIYAEVTP